ncbi:hypothetical protein [Streptomyces sp. SID12488]|nr:hypothetical protein [Streptomyces sp. SID12488]NEA68774.1 hypothetical protein [Streptomyces sp. SID12488]
MKRPTARKATTGFTATAAAPVSVLAFTAPACASSETVKPQAVNHYQ